MTGTIFVGASEFSVGEADGQILIPIVRTGDLSGAVTVEFATTADTASAGSDYLNTSGSVTMAAGEDRVLVPVSILDDGSGEATETFVLSLVNVDSGFLQAPRTARINILDDETPATDEPQPPLTSNYDVSREVVVPGLNQPIAFDFAPHDPSLMYVAEKGGVIKIHDLDTGSSLGTFLDISDKVNNIQDRGLMDIAFHPDFEANPYVYAFYVVDPPGTAGETGNDGPDGGGNRFAYVVRFTADADNDYRTVVPGSETILVGAAGQTLSDISGNGAVDSTNSANINVRASDVDPDTGEYIQDYIKVDSRSHAGGALEFGPDGALYVSIGDGTSFNFTDPRTVSVQDVDSLSGKILRINPLTGQGLADNPFVEPGDSLDANSSKVYQLGLRNPFKIAFDENGQLFISETGWNSWEEINSGGRGANFGWPYYEGDDNGTLQQTNGYSGLAGADDFYAAVENGEITVTAPFRAFSHANGDPGFQVQAIVGSGRVYTGSVYPEEFQNDYFFTDVAQGEGFTVDTNDRRDVKYLYTTDNGFGPVHFQQGPDGYMYYADLLTGEIGRLQIEGPLASLTARVDNEFQLYVNGVEVLTDDDWRDAETISLVLEPGDQIAVRAVDTGGPGGAFFDITLADGTRIGSSADWLVSQTAPGDWTAKGYDDSGWAAATEYGGPGADPWAGGAISPFLPGDSPGKWIWSDDNDGDNEVYLRFVVPTANTAPAAADDMAATEIEAPITIDVIANDSDPDGDTLTITSVTAPANGTAVIDDNGTSDPTDDRIVYTPDDGSGSATVEVLSASFGSGAEGFAYQDDLFRGTSRGAYATGQYGGSGGQSGGGLTVTVGGINNTDITDGMSGGWTADFTLSEDAPATLTFSYRAIMNANYEADEFAEVLAAIDGTLIGQGGSDAIVRLTGNGNGGSAMDTGWVTVTLDLGTLSAGTHTLALGGYNNQKTYNDESVAFRFDDVSVSVAQDGAPFVGTDTFTYTVSDGTDTSTATVTVEVGGGQNTAPVAGDDDRATDQDTLLIVTIADLLANDGDADGDTLFLTGFTQPANGTLQDNGDGTLTYTPDAGFNGFDSFTYTVSDGQETDTATVDLTVGTVAEPEVVSDDFSGPVLDAIWSLEGPAGTADVATAGDEAFLQIDVPIGDFNAFDENRSARVLQDAPDEDFEVEAKFLSQPSERFQYQGILVEQDADTWLRFDVFSDGTSQFVFAATTDNGDSTSRVNLPIATGDASHLRATRAGDDWTLSYSADGQTWTEAGTFTFAMTVTAVGPLAGATASPGDGPGFTAQVDYFFNTASPIVPEDGAGNTPPVADDDSLATVADTELVVSVNDLLANDNDVDGDPLFLTGFTQPANGTLQDNGDGTLTYIPNAGFSGPDSFTYTISDGTDTDTATVTVTVADPVNTPPVAQDDTATTDQETPLVLGIADLLSNDSDTDGDTLFLSDFTQPANGTLQDNGDGTLTYTPNAGFSGADSFTYTISDSTETATATVNLTVDAASGTSIVSDDFSGPALDAIWSLEGPAGTADVASAGDEAFLQIDVPIGDFNAFNENRSARVLQDAADEDFEVEAKFLSQPSERFQYQGILVEQDADTWLRFDVFSDGTSQFIFAATTETGASTSRFNLPIATGDASHLRATRSGDDWVLSYSADGQTWTEAGTFTFAMTVTAVGPLAGATASPGDGPGFTAQVDYVFNTASPIVPEDGVVNTAPVAGDDALATDADNPLVISFADDLLANDSDADGDTLFLTGFTQPADGVLLDNGDGTLTYTPNAGFSGDDSFTYTVSDGTDTATATVTVTVADPVNTPPVAQDDTAATSAGTQVAIDVLANDSDADGDAVTITSFSDPANGTAVIDDSGTPSDPTDDRIVYTPDSGSGTSTVTVLSASFDGDADGFTYQDDLFRGTSRGAYASGQYDGNGGQSGGGLGVTVGGIDNTDITDGMSGGWTTSFTLNKGGPVTLTFKYRAIMDSDYESNEFVEVLAAIDGTLVGQGGSDAIVRLTGNGNGGPNMDTGWVTVTLDLSTLEAGTHTLALGGYNNRKTYFNESTEFRFDDVVVQVTEDDPGFTGTDSFTYTVTDGTDTDTATVTVTVRDGANTPPVAADDQAATPDGTAVAIDVLANDGDADGDALTITSVSDPANGTAVIDDNGTPGDPTDDRIVYTPDAGTGPVTVEVLSADFSGSAVGFTYQDDLFRGTSRPAYATGDYSGNAGQQGGGLEAALGGVDGSDITDGMSGGWTTSFTLDQAGPATLTFSYRLEMSLRYDPGEFSEVLAAVDGTLIGTGGNDYVDRLEGFRGNGGSTDTGWVTVTLDLGTLEAGTHTLALGGFNNKKTTSSEETSIRFDNVSVAVTQDDPGFVGVDSFTYTVSDGSDTSTATVDVTVGGKAVIASEDFEAGAQAWSDGTTTDGGAAFSTFLGRFGGGGEQTSKSFAVTDGADQVEITFDFYELDSWDGDEGNRFAVYINGTEIFAEDFFHAGRAGRDGNDPAAGGRTGAVSWSIEPATDGQSSLGFASGSAFTDQVHQVTLLLDNPGTSFTLGFGSTLDQEIDDESFGIDNLVVTAIDLNGDMLLG